MSIFDAVKQMIGSEAGGDAGLMTHAMNLVNSPEIGGVSGLVEKFHSNGLGGVVNSWVSNGANQAISAEEIQKVLGSDRINGIASKLGISPEDASAKLAQYLPSVVDKLTPGGSIPASS